MYRSAQHARSVDVSVVIPVKNRARLIAIALDSISSQTWSPSEIIVVDDGSVDGSGDVAASHGAKVVRTESSRGIGAARNAGIEAASGRWIAFLDSDDAWSPEHLQTVVSASERGYGFVTTAAVTSTGVIRGNGAQREIRLTPCRVLESAELVNTSSVLVDRLVLLEAGLFTALPQAEDLQLWFRALERTTGVALPVCTTRYTVHGGQVSHETDLMRRCVQEVISEAMSRPSMQQYCNPARFFIRDHWDDFRGAQASENWAEAWRHLRWIIGAPRGWAALARLLNGRRVQRRRAKRLDESELALMRGVVSEPRQD